jgi:translation elongation factor EF-1beta
MGTALVTIKMMPESPSSDLNAIEEKAKQIIEEFEGKKSNHSKRTNRFWINAVFINFALDESKQIDPSKKN